MPVLLFFTGVTFFGVGSWAFLYAHHHAPTPDSDPMAEYILSHAAYNRLYYGGSGLLILGAVLIVVSLMIAVRRESSG